MSDPPPVFVVIVNWNGEHDTAEAVRSVEALDYPDVTILVVDNGSRPESAEAIRLCCPAVECIETGRNLGYAGGNNAGLRMAMERGAAFCLVLNNDMTVDPPMLRLLVEEAERDPSLAVVGPRIYRYDKPDALFYTGWAIDWGRWLFHRVPARESAREPTADSPKPLLEADYVQGCAMLLRTSFLRNHGCFDERFHLYCEDADLCVRARRAGFRVAEVAVARAWHKGYGSSGGRSPLKVYYGLRNRLLFIAKHAPRANRPLLCAQLLGFDAGGQALGAVGRILRGDLRGGGAVLRALACALWDWTRGKYGQGPEWLFAESRRRASAVGDR